MVGGEAGNLQCAVALAITAAPFLVAAAEAPNRLLHPLALFGFTMLLGVAGQAIYLTHVDPGASSELLSGLPTDILGRGLLVVSVGVIALCVGYVVASPSRGRPRPSPLLEALKHRGLGNPSPNRAFWAVTVLLGVAVLSFVMYAPKIGIHSFADLLTSRKRFVDVGSQQTVFGYYRFLIGLTGVGFIMAVFTITRVGLRWRSKLGLMAIASISFTALFATVTSSRTELFAVLAAALLVSVSLRQREPRPATVFVTALLALAGLGLLLGLRNSEEAGKENQSVATAASPGALLEQATGSREWMAIGPISVVVTRVPEAYPYQYGETLLSILWAPIPRTLWPGKPPVSIGPVISPPVFGFSLQRRTGDPPGIIGELWLNGSWPVVILGMAVLGWAIRKTDRWYHQVKSTDGLTSLLYGAIVVALCLAIPGNDVTAGLSRALEELAVLGLLLWVARSRTVLGDKPTQVVNA